MITLGFVKSSTIYTKREEKLKNATSISESCKNSDFVSKSISAYPYTKINFRGKNAIALAEIPSIHDVNLNKIVLKIKKSGKNPIIISDYDGVHTDFALTRGAQTPTAKPHIGEEAFLALNDKLNQNGIPFVILTTRSFEKLKDPSVMGQNVADSINAVCLNGNQVRLTLDMNHKTKKFIQQWEKKSDYKTSVKELPNNKVKIAVDPIIPQELHNIAAKYNQDLKPLGFELNNESLITYFKWNKLFHSSKEASIEKPLVIKVNDNIFKNISDFGKNNQNKAEDKTISIQASENKTLQLSYDGMVEYGLGRFKQICNEQYGTKLSTKTLNNLNPIELQTTKALSHDQKENRYFEIADIRSKAIHKGVSVETLSELLGKKEKAFPIFMGDSVSGQKDDEFGMKKVSELKGIGIAILKGNSKDNLEERLALQTQADYKLGSFEDTEPFLTKFAGLFNKGEAL